MPIKIKKYFLYIRKLFLKIEFLLASLKNLTNANNTVIPKAKAHFCSGFPSLSLFVFSFVHSGQLSEQFSRSQAAFRTTFESQAAIEKPVQAS
jgi:hypothetical protein